MSAQSPDTTAPAQPNPNSLASRLTTLSVASSLFMQSIDSTALSTALPTLARAFDTNPINLKLCLTAYILALAVFVPASAWAADRFGAKRIFVTAMGVFLLGSITCALSHSLLQLVSARILQGAGGAMMTPVGRIIVVGSHPRDQLVKAMIWLTTPAMLGPILGPPLSGFILSVASWPWIFYINLPVGLLGMAAVIRFVPHTRQPHPGRFDSLGFLLAASCICGAMVGAELVGVNLFPRWVQLTAWAIAIGAGWSYLRHAKTIERPVLNLGLLKVRTLRANQTGGTLLRMSIGATPFLLPLLLQGGLGWTPLRAGLATMATAFGSMGARLGAQTLLRRFGFRNMLVWTALACGFAVAAIGFMRNSTPLIVLLAVLATSGFLRANNLTSASTLAFADIPDTAVSQASSLSSVIQQLAQALGITLGGVMLHLSQTMTGPHGYRDLAPENFVLPFCAIGVCCGLAAITYWALPPDAGSNMHGRGRTRIRR